MIAETIRAKLETEYEVAQQAIKWIAIARSFALILIFLPLILAVVLASDLFWVMFLLVSIPLIIPSFIMGRQLSKRKKRVEELEKVLL